MRSRILNRLKLALCLCLLSITPSKAQENTKERIQENKIPVVATFSILADFVRQVGGERVLVTSLVGPGGDAHVYAPTPADAKTLSQSRLIFVNGLQFEGWLDRLVASSGSKATIVTATNGIKPQQETEAGIVKSDPHAWQNIANAKIYVANIRDALAKSDPAGKSAYDANAANYLVKLDALETDVKVAIAKIPADKRKIITSHDAFGYFGKAYGLEFIAPQGVSTESEPSAKDVAKIIQQIRAAKIPAIFLENITDPRLIKRMASETGAKIGGALFSDSLSDEKGPAATYIDMMRSNIRELTAALLI